MIETYKDRIKKSYLVATSEIDQKNLRQLAKKRFQGRSFVIKTGYVKNDLLYFRKPAGAFKVVKVAFTKKEA